MVMANTFAGMNGDVVFQGAVSKGDTDMSAILTEIAASAPDVVYLPVFVPESEFLVSQAANTPGLEDAVMMTADGSFSATFAQNTGAAAVGVVMTGPHVSGDAYSAFLDLWAEEQPGAALKRHPAASTRTPMTPQTSADGRSRSSRRKRWTTARFSSDVKRFVTPSRRLRITTA